MNVTCVVIVWLIYRIIHLNHTITLLRWRLIHTNKFHYRISTNKRARRGGRKRTFILVWYWWKSRYGLLNTLTLSGKNMIQIGLVVPEIWSVKVKSWGHVYSSRRVYSAKYGIDGMRRIFHPLWKHLTSCTVDRSDTSDLILGSSDAGFAWSTITPFVLWYYGKIPYNEIQLKSHDVGLLWDFRRLKAEWNPMTVPLSGIFLPNNNQSVEISRLGVKLLDPIPWGPICMPGSYHVYRSEIKMFDTTNSKLLCWDKPEGVRSLSWIVPSTVMIIKRMGNPCDITKNIRWVGITCI